MTTPEQLPVNADAPQAITGAQFTETFDEPLERTLDIDTWHRGYEALYDERLHHEISEATEQQFRIEEGVRKIVYDRLSTRPGAPEIAGLYEVPAKQLEDAHRGILFSGNIEACDGTSFTIDTLPLTITQIGACTTSYRGADGEWVHRLYRRDLRARNLDILQETLDLLDRRAERAAFDTSSPRDKLSDLARRGIMTFAERNILTRKCKAIWRMGHGNVMPYELLTGSGMVDLVMPSLTLLEELILQHKKFIFVPSNTSDRVLLTIGSALREREYAIVDTMEEFVGKILRGHYRGPKWESLIRPVSEFRDRVGSQVVVGVYRASRISPPQVFYAHIEHAHTAAAIAMADSTLQEHRGFPMLIDLADTICRVSFGNDALNAITALAFQDKSAPFSFTHERQTRR